VLPARAAVVVPNGTLFGDGVCARIKEELLKEFNLHTIVRLPNGVFAPYTGIPTNLLFFDRSGPTREVWYYEQPLPEGRKNYTKTAPIQFRGICTARFLVEQAPETDNGWKVPAAELLANGCNLDRKNPRAKEDITHLPPAQLAANILKKEQRIAEIMGNIQKLLAKAGMSKQWPILTLGDALIQRDCDVAVKAAESYQFAGVYCFGRGVFRGQEKLGNQFAYQRLTRLRSGDFVYPKLMAWEGAFGVVPAKCDGCVVSPEFPVFELNRERMSPEFLNFYFKFRESGKKYQAGAQARMFADADFIQMHSCGRKCRCHR